MRYCLFFMCLFVTLPDKGMEMLELKKYSRIALLLLFDVVIIYLSSYIALMLGFEFSLARGEELRSDITSYLFINVISTLVIFAFLGLYRSIWKFASIIEAGKVIIASLISSVLYYFGNSMVNDTQPETYYVIYFLLLMFLAIIPRFFYRAMRTLKVGYLRHGPSEKHIMIIGAGECGSLLIRDINTNEKFENCRAVCVIDDDTQKIGNRLHGVKVVGTRKDIPDAVKKYKVDEIIYAIPTATNADKAEILNICKDTKCKLKTLPSIFQIVSGKIDSKNVRAVEIEDLLGRPPIVVDVAAVVGYVKGKTILVTGGGGSIGSELCRQIAAHNPKCLIIFDIYENNAYEIQNELKRKYPELNLVVLIGSVRDENRVNGVFEKYLPNIIYHAAAHKHVPLMEDSPNEAIKNNVFGTLAVARAADKYGADRFVLISTDKAVNPTNVMGATKRICEMIVQAFDRISKTEYVAVRFGNVLGSNGSVVPLFKQQIREGGPVTVMDREIIRYFMTISEAVSLVIEAGAIAKGGEIFILDMGQPVKILDLAENLIKLSGFKPYEEIDIQFTGLRPGEKLYEELLMEEEGIQSTQNELIFIGKPVEMEPNVLFEKLECIYKTIKNEQCDVKKMISEIVPTYHYNE